MHRHDVSSRTTSVGVSPAPRRVRAFRAGFLGVSDSSSATTWESAHSQAFSSITGQLQDGQRRKQKKIKIWQEIDERNPGSLSQAVEKSRRSLAAAGAPDVENEPRVRFRDVIHVNNGTATSREGRIRRALLSESLRRRQEHGFDFQSLRGIRWWFALRFRNEPRRRQSLCDR